MKIILVHGDDAARVAVRVAKFVDAAHSRGWLVERIDGSSDNLRQTVGGRSLFDKERFFVIDNLKKISKSDLAWLKEHKTANQGNLVFENFGKLSKTFINSLPVPDTIEVFDVPQKLWSFLDSFYPGNTRICLKYFHEALSTAAPELIYALLARRLKDIYLADCGGSQGNSWQEKKVQNQAAKFTKGKVGRVYGALAMADYQAKTGGGSSSDLLDLIIATHLE